MMGRLRAHVKPADSVLEWKIATVETFAETFPRSLVMTAHRLAGARGTLDVYRLPGDTEHVAR